MRNSHEPAPWFEPPEDGLLENDKPSSSDVFEASSGLGDQGQSSEESRPNEGGWSLESVEPMESEAFERPTSQVMQEEEPRGSLETLSNVEEPAWTRRTRPTIPSSRTCAVMGREEPELFEPTGPLNRAASVTEPRWSAASSNLDRCPEEARSEPQTIEPLDSLEHEGREEEAHAVTQGGESGHEAIVHSYPVPELDENLEREPEAVLDHSPRVVRARVASLSAKGLSWFVDGGLIVGVVTLFMGLASFVAGSGVGLSSVLTDAAVALSVALFCGLLGAGYVALSVALCGQTLGGRLAGVRILDKNGDTPELSRSLIRGLVGTGGVLLLGAGLAWVLVDERGQTLHDRLAGTFAVEE